MEITRWFKPLIKSISGAVEDVSRTSDNTKPSCLNGSSISDHLRLSDSSSLNSSGEDIFESLPNSPANNIVTEMKKNSPTIIIKFLQDKKDNFHDVNTHNGVKRKIDNDPKHCKVLCLDSTKGLKAKCIAMKFKWNPEPVHTGPNELFRLTMDSEEDEYEVEMVLKHKRDKAGKHLYFVKWVGWPDESNSWEPYGNLLNCPEKLADFPRPAQQRSDRQQREDHFKRNKNKLFQVISDCVRRSDATTLYKLKDSVPPANSTVTKTGLNDLAKQLREKLNKQICKKSESTRPTIVECLYDKELLTEILIYAENRRLTLLSLAEWECQINKLSNIQCPLMVENQCDLEGPPEDFTYITDYKAGEGIVIPDDPIMGCECSDCHQQAKQCGGAHDKIFAYNKHSTIMVQSGTPIYECNKRCKCPASCFNRVVQKGRQVQLCIFRTSNGRGWGVKTLQKIRKGAFVMEYVGEVIRNEEAEKRGQAYDEAGVTYLFDLDYNDSDNCQYTVDAAKYGNVAHFMNHSCCPNLTVYAVWINCLEPNLPRIAFFSNREIKTGEELTFDYMKTYDETSSKSAFRNRGPLSSGANSEDSLTSDEETEIRVKPNVFKCKCGADKCRGFFFNQEPSSNDNV